MLVHEFTEAKSRTKEGSYLLQLERDDDLLVLHIKSTKTGNRTEVRGKPDYEGGGYDPDDPLHQLLDKIGKAANISDLMNGAVVSINPRHPEGPSAIRIAKDIAGESIAEARLQPDRDYISIVGEILDDANAEYVKFLKNNNDKDDLEELIDLLQAYTGDELDITWHIGETGKKAVDWYIQSAIVHGDGSIDVIIDPDSTIGHWGPKSFKDSVLKTLAHETIHLAQRDRMGVEKYKNLPSGYMLGIKKAEKSGKERDLIRTYFRDPQELMAHGHDLAQEILASSNPEEALRNPEKYRDELPAYDKHRQIFPPNAKPLQRLLSYASGYVNESRVYTNENL